MAFPLASACKRLQAPGVRCWWKSLLRQTRYPVARHLLVACWHYWHPPSARAGPGRPLSLQGLGCLTFIPGYRLLCPALPCSTLPYPPLPSTARRPQTVINVAPS